MGQMDVISRNLSVKEKLNKILTLILRLVYGARTIISLIFQTEVILGEFGNKSLINLSFLPLIHYLQSIGSQFHIGSRKNSKLVPLCFH